jgi:hypothetical protein
MVQIRTCAVVAATASAGIPTPRQPGGPRLLSSGFCSKSSIRRLNLSVVVGSMTSDADRHVRRSVFRVLPGRVLDSSRHSPSTKHDDTVKSFRPMPEDSTAVAERGRHTQREAVVAAPFVADQNNRDPDPDPAGSWSRPSVTRNGPSVGDPRRSHKSERRCILRHPT